MDVKSWPPILDTDDMPKKKLTAMYRAPTAEMLAYLDFRYTNDFSFHDNATLLSSEIIPEWISGLMFEF